MQPRAQEKCPWSCAKLGIRGGNRSAGSQRWHGSGTWGHGLVRDTEELREGWT